MSSHPIKSPRKLIEVALPLDAINVACAREKSIRHGHPSTLHLWWARRPLAAARAVIFAQLVNDPGYQQGGGFKYGKNKKDAAIERKRLFKIIEDLVLWDNTTNEEVLERARAEIRRSWREVCELNKDHPQAAELFNPDKLPALHDPFAGGGAIPLEAQRLGLEAYASDLNPVAVLINKAMIEIPPKFAGRPPVNPGTRASRPPQSSESSQDTRVSGIPKAHKGWNSRGYLPHFDQPDMVQSITFRLCDSVPQTVIDGWKSELNLSGQLRVASHPDCVELRKRIQQYEDAGHGACFLKDPAVAEIVENALLHFDGSRYRLIAWCIMPNHVHVMAEMLPGHRLADILHSWKSFTAKEANKALKRQGQFWMEDYHDRFIRDEKHFSAAKNYIENNPVAAGLAKHPSDWQWSSALGTQASHGQCVQDSLWGQAGGTPAFPGEWPGATGLAEDVRYYGAWMREEAQKRIGHLYPPVEITAEMAAGSAGVSPARPDLLPLVGQKLTVIAWLWARTVKSPNPAFSHVDVPLASTFILSSKAGKEAFVQPVIEGDQYKFTVKVGTPPPDAEKGTKLARGANFKCILSDVAIAGDYIKAEGRAGRMGAKMMAIVAEGARGRIYLAPTPEMEAIALTAQPTWKPELSLPDDPRNFWTPSYGLTTYGDLFTPRQLVALTTFSDLVGEVRKIIRQDAEKAEFSHEATKHTKEEKHTSENLRSSVSSCETLPLDQGGTGPQAYAEAISVYLGVCIDRLADSGSSLTSWAAPRDSLRTTFGRQALPMVWDFAESNPIEVSAGSFYGASEWASKALIHLPACGSGTTTQADAQTQIISAHKTISTDPPYYDNIGYADLSDFFYVWLRKSLRDVFPSLLSTIAVPKAEELVATPYRRAFGKKTERCWDGVI